MGWYARHTQELQPPNRTIGYTGPTRRLLTHQATSWTQHLYKLQTARTLVAHTHHPHEHIKPTTITNTMKTCSFCSTQTQNTALQPLIHGDSGHLHNHCTNAHITLTKHRSNVDISQAIRSLSTLLNNIPYPAPAQQATFRTTLLAGLHHFDNSTYTHPSGIHCTNHLPEPIPTTQQRTHHSVQSSASL